MQIYLITNKINGKIYVGQCQGLASDRWCRHKYDARSNRYNSRLGRAILKYGPDAFTLTVLVNNVASKEILDYLEQYFIVLYDSQNPNLGYNITRGGDGSYGLKLSPETCAKISKTKIGNRNCVGRTLSEMTRQKISQSNKRYHESLTPEQRKRGPNPKISATLKGRKFSPEHVAKMRDASIKYWNSLPSEQRKRSAESIAKTAAGLRGQKRTPEQIERMRKAHRGHKRSPECIKRFQDTMFLKTVAWG
jgi:group I intron endonuclease